jgi:hypothetical protein
VHSTSGINEYGTVEEDIQAKIEVLGEKSASFSYYDGL